MSAKCIELRGVEVHNLKGVDLDIPHRQLTALCGVSGSGKTSLAFDTLYAEGQRRYIETFSAYTRQFLEQLEKPAVARIDGLPPSIAVTRKDAVRSNRSTVATATEVADYLRLLFAKAGRVTCPGCAREVRRDTPQSIRQRLVGLPADARLLVTFLREASDIEALTAELKLDGFLRVIAGDRLIHLADEPLPSVVSGESPYVSVVVDRLTTGNANDDRLLESLETALNQGEGRCNVLVSCDDNPADGETASGTSAATLVADNGTGAQRLAIDGRTWLRLGFSSGFSCEDCGREFFAPEPRLFSFNSPLGACPSCEGIGQLIDVDSELVIPDPSKSLADGAIAPWNSPAYAQPLGQLLEVASARGLPVDIPYRELTADQLAIVWEGSPEHDYAGIRGFFRSLEKHRYKIQTRQFLARWRSERVCPDCGGARLRPEALAARVGGRNIAEVLRLEVVDALQFTRALGLADEEFAVTKRLIDQIESRLRYLEAVGLGYLNLDRTLGTLSGGEGQRVALTSALGSNLVNMLYVLDEPTVGLHPRDVERLTATILGLRDRGNTVVVVEHEEALLRAADYLVEIGPGAGESGGRVVFTGTLDEMRASPQSLTGAYLSGRRMILSPDKRRQPNHGWIRLTGARGHNLRNVSVEFPLGVLCLVTGVSGSGKSTLVQQTLYGALCQRKRKTAEPPCPYNDVFGDGQVDDVILVDQSPIGRSPRSNPVTYIKAFDQIRAVFAETLEARTHNYDAGHFSFNVTGGRCEKCQGDGYLEIDMQFLPDVFIKCSECNGTRYRKEILRITYRGRNIADVLDMTVRGAFTFFRGQTKVQAKLKQLMDVGLDYLRLGQPANTLSAGEAQRLKLAAYLSSAGRSRTLFLLDEPTTGLHFADIVQLLDCFDALLNCGHSLIVVEHNLQVMKAADYIIDLGPGAAAQGGTIVVQGTPEKIARCELSATGRLLNSALAADLREPA